MKSIFKVILIGLVSVGLFGCKNSRSLPSGKEKIKIGEVTPLTGAEATFGISTHRGLELAIQEINASGGIHGRLLELITFDDQGKTEEAVLGVEKLVSQEGVIAVVGEVASTRSIAMAPIAQNHQVPMIAPSSIHSKVTQQGDYIFRVCYIDQFQSKVMADVAFNMLHAQRVAFLIDVKSDYSRDSARLFAHYFEKKGGKIVIQQSYSTSDINFRAQLTAIRAEKPDVILVPGYYTEIGLVVRQARELGIQVPLLGGDGWDSPVLKEIAKASLDGTYFVSHFSQDYSSKNGKKFLNLYHSTYGQGKTGRYENAPPDGLTALGYDTGLLIADALRRAKNVTRADLRTALMTTKNLPGLTGNISINSDRNAQKSAAVFKFVEGGQLKLARMVDP